MHVQKSKIIVRKVLQLPECCLEFLNSFLPPNTFVVRKQTLGVICIYVRYFLVHKLVHSLRVQSLQSVLQRLVAVYSRPVLEGQFGGIITREFIY